MDFTLQTIFYRKLGALLGLIQFLKTYKSRLTISFVFEVFVKALFYMGHPNTKKNQRHIPYFLITSKVLKSIYVGPESDKPSFSWVSKDIFDTLKDEYNVIYFRAFKEIPKVLMVLFL